MEGKEIINSILVNENSLLDTTVEEILIYKNRLDNIEIKLSITNFNRKSKFKKIQLIFDDVIRFNFYHDKRYSFYNIESFKFMQLENGEFYISLDPDDGKEEQSDNDLDYIFSNGLQMVIIQ